jgi:hypothetical protein
MEGMRRQDLWVFICKGVKVMMLLGKLGKQGSENMNEIMRKKLGAMD